MTSSRVFQLLLRDPARVEGEEGEVGSPNGRQTTGDFGSAVVWTMAPGAASGRMVQAGVAVGDIQQPVST